jgi:hypothetical protein
VATANAAPVPVSVVNWDLIMNSQGFPQKLAGLHATHPTQGNDPAPHGRSGSPRPG